MTGIGRREVLKGLGVTTAAAVTPTHWAMGQADKTITVTSYGGVFENAMRKVFVPDYARRTGGTAKIQLGNPDLWVSQVQASPNKPPLDVILSSPEVVLQAGPSGVFDIVTPDKVPNMVDVPKFFVDICKGWGIGFDYGAAGLAYHKGRIKNPPKSLKEFVDRTAKGEWTASLSNVAFQPGIGNVIWSLNDVYGGKVSDITPALEAIKRMKPHSIFWSNVNDFLNHLASGEADIGIYNDGRTWSYYDTGATWIDFINPTEGAVIKPIMACKPKGAPSYAWEFIDSMVSPGPQGEFAALMNFGMTNSKTQYSDKVKARITPFDKARMAPVEEMGKYTSEWVERWNKEIGA